MDGSEPIVKLGVVVTCSALAADILKEAFSSWRRRRRIAQRAEAVRERVLSNEERLTLRRHGFLEIVSQLVPGRRYRIPAGGSPVAALEPDGHVVYLCLQPETPVARNELVVIHKLLLEGAEADYWQRANRVGRAMGRGIGRRLF